MEAGEKLTAEDKVNEAVAARAGQPNMSFSAFTATPKGRTVELFGHVDAASKLKRAVLVYSMRQAVEEGFIRDFLENYIPFDVFWKVSKSTKWGPRGAGSRRHTGTLGS